MNEQNEIEKYCHKDEYCFRGGNLNVKKDRVLRTSKKNKNKNETKPNRRVI